MTRILLPLARFRLKNFKAIRDSGNVKLTPLTVFIGNNGVGKSSLIEGMEMVQSFSRDGLDKAMQHWRGFEYIWNQAVPHEQRPTTAGKRPLTNSMCFSMAGSSPRGKSKNAQTYSFRAESEITATQGYNEVFFYRESLETKEPLLRKLERTTDGRTWEESAGDRLELRLAPDESILSAETSIPLWQFVRLNPEAMSGEKPLRRVFGYLPLATDGSNIAEYLLDIRTRDPQIIDGIVETLQTVLPYVVDVQTAVTNEIGRNAYLQLTEGKFKLPGWLFSTGTLRVLALLALFRHPDPPSLIVIEEIENGLDPRTVNLIIEEIRELVSTGRSQVIITTHSPYLLDLVPLSSLIFVERVNGQPTFTRPATRSADKQSIERWSQDFAPGKLYTMGRFRQG